jgi:hypothetical protein
MSSQLTSKWQIISGGPPAHISWLVDGSGTKAVYKVPRDRSEKKLVEPFNEVVCYRLTSVLGTSTTEIYLEWAAGEPGVISLVKSEMNFSVISSGSVSLTWENQQFLNTLLVVDWWLANTDRPVGKPDHLMVIKNGEGITLCPIDYSHALNGCSGEMFALTTVTDPNKIPVSSYSHISEPYVKGFADLEPAIAKIEHFDGAQIDHVVDSAVAEVSTGRPAEEVSFLGANAEVVKALLKARQANLRPSMREWCSSKGKVV